MSRKPANGLPKPDDLNQTWAFLEEGVSQVMENLQKGMSYPRCMELYTCAISTFLRHQNLTLHSSIYNFCTQNKMQRFGDHTAGGKGRLDLR